MKKSVFGWIAVALLAVGLSGCIGAADRSYPYGYPQAGYPYYDDFYLYPGGYYYPYYPAGPFSPRIHFHRPIGHPSHVIHHGTFRQHIRKEHKAISDRHFRGKHPLRNHRLHKKEHFQGAPHLHRQQPARGERHVVRDGLKNKGTPEFRARPEFREKRDLRGDRPRKEYWPARRRGQDEKGFGTGTCLRGRC